MKTKYSNLLPASLCVVGLFTAVTGAKAEDFAQTAAGKQKSLTQGFGQATLSTLQRTAVTSQTEASTVLLNKLCAGCSVNRKTEGTALQITNDALFLSVAGDGTSAEFRDLAVEQKAHSLAQPLQNKMSLAALEQAGRSFIASKLVDLIILGPGEELVALSTDYRIEGLQNLSTAAVTRSVVANRVVVGRTMNGVPVVGNGSTVVVTFANDSSVESFRYDWPKYESVASQNVVNTSSLLGRVQQVIGARMGFVSTSSVRVPTVQEASVPVDLNSNTKLQALQCGYYDAGSAAGHALVQPGCVYHAVFEDSTGMRQCLAGAVPGSLPFVSDAKWMETQILK